MSARAFPAFFWSGIDVFLRQGAQFGFSIILARLLTPTDFGVLAFTALFVGLASTVVEGGLSAALIQKKDVSLSDESAAYWFNLTAAFIMALVLWFLSSSIANYFDYLILGPITKILGVNLIIVAAGSVHSTLLTRRLEFRVQAKIGGWSIVIAGTVAVILALRGYGMWALVAQTVVASAVTSLLLWKYSKWRPTRKFSLSSLASLWSLGGYLFAAALLDTFYQRIYTLFIGKHYGASDLAFYSRAEGVKQMPSGIMHSLSSRVIFPVFSEVAATERPSELILAVKRSIKLIMLVNVPVMLIIAALADPLVWVLFGEKWMPASGILWVLCISGLFWPLHMINGYALVAQGQGVLFFRIEMFKKMVGLLILFFGFQHGVIGVAWAQIAIAFAGFVLDSYYTKKILKYGPLAQAFDVLPIILISIFGAVGAYMTMGLYDLNSLKSLFVSMCAGASVVALGILIFFDRLTGVSISQAALFLIAGVKKIAF